MGDGIGSTIILIFTLLLVMLGAYFTTKFLSVKTRRLTKCKYIDIKDRMYVGRDKHIVLLTVGDQAFLVGITNQAISLIGTLKKEDIASAADASAETSTGAGFKGIFGKMSGFMKNAGSAQEELRKARLAEKIRREGSMDKKTQAEQDEIDKILNAIHERKNRSAEQDRHEGDGHEEG